MYPVYIDSNVMAGESWRIAGKRDNGTVWLIFLVRQKTILSRLSPRIGRHDLFVLP